MVEVTVILPVCNAGDHVDLALDLIRAQSMRDFECIIVDDGSVDRTVQVVEDAVRGDARFSVLRLDRTGGVARARNRGLEHAEGEWVWFVDVDDEWSPHLLRSMVNAISQEDVDLVVCGARERFGSTSTPLPLPRPAPLDTAEALTSFLRGELQGFLWNKLIRRSILGPSPFPSISSKSDVVGLVGFLPRVRRVEVVDEILYEYIRREGSITGSRANAPANALLAADAVASAGWDSAFGVADRELAYFRMRSALAYVHDLLRFRDWEGSRDLRDVRARITGAGLLHAARLGRWYVVGKAMLLKTSPALYVRVAAVTERRR